MATTASPSRTKRLPIPDAAPLRIDLSEGRILLLCVALTVALRLPMLALPLGPDESGYLLVAQQWSTGSGSLYGGQWVDRPPLLIGLYWLVSHLGVFGVWALGAAAASTCVAACTSAARNVAGNIAARWAALVSAVLMSSLLIQGVKVDAELPAMAFVSLSVALLVRWRTWMQLRWAAMAGVTAGAAALCKQSIFDGVVFACVLAAAMIVLERKRTFPALNMLTTFLVSTIATLSLSLLWATTTTPGVDGYLNALYTFRSDALQVILQDGGSAVHIRALVFAGAALGGGLLGVIACSWIGAAAPFRDGALRMLRPPTIALLGMLTFSTLTIVGGGSWWLHYLIQTVPAVAILTGITLATGGRKLRKWARIAVFQVVATAAVGCLTIIAGASPLSPGTEAQDVAAWLHSAARPGDSGFVSYGRPDILRAGGLETAYPYLWSLPMRVRDGQLTQLRRTLESPAAPTWFIAWSKHGNLDVWSIPGTATLGDVLRTKYVKAAEVCGRPVYLLRTAPTRSLPAVPGDCGASDVHGVTGLPFAR
jgi:4-amino-4-deoxy-L-arabinose transferase-like glycosyltransferase